jgi:hypothetical protein
MLMSLLLSFMFFSPLWWHIFKSHPFAVRISFDCGSVPIGNAHACYIDDSPVIVLDPYLSFSVPYPTRRHVDVVTSIRPTVLPNDL